jgi:FkbM family methyltransferase
VRDFGLVVIGAHTGQYLRKIISEYTDKNILLVEPVPYNYMVLEREYSNKENFFICKNAILDNSSKQIFFYVKKESVKKLGKHWATGIGSFDKNHILSHKGKRFNITDEDIQKIEIDFITFKDLTERYSIKSIDKLQLDVEGAEYKILNSIDFNKLKINQIFFESKHFDGTFVEGKKLEETKKMLEMNGYALEKVDSENILAKKIISD